MTPYKGIIRIVCTRKGKCLKNYRKDVKPECMGCSEAASQVLDLEGKVLHEHVAPMERKYMKK